MSLTETIVQITVITTTALCILIAGGITLGFLIDRMMQLASAVIKRKRG